ncbi:arsenite efflux transporter metallochaperone ArsD [Pseudomonas aeruginosa]|uniref:arsenite efflux transporter metallochaperone ArsD n=1 Tax=Pseudomonas aeruginosa TaxID=287 RepID=UPI0029091FDB|nr:arsenite efflux transporter metallochaperone ArsD [Pseudomonas aeruginosa]MDY1389778.1 arsenite efflux transporter metallochaperone ArsD [Pseudomonas aeruginosa]MDY1401637.1 arsenite efflux transporter metallochaperone ArsD [Pseudomonas aeruginosa]HCF7666262.1 arsenite efflux transporter metallochaperone ArsD [Pseudomonas aeruginosa]HEB0636005.1 arsenite efflux transporter metallochaperone ArsD [Pseudomonas aeruginosa]HEB0647740.1 arsenite efflux transporter metallochaperone ArsD [Pseudomon
MHLIQIYDPVLCCSTGVCGVEVDQPLVTFASDVEWAIRQGANVQRFNLAHEPQAFAEQSAVRDFLQRSGQGSLPLTLVDGEIVMAGRYPSRTELAHWAAVQASPSTDSESNGCCSSGRCC